MPIEQIDITIEDVSGLSTRTPWPWSKWVVRIDREVESLAHVDQRNHYRPSKKKI